MIKSLIRGILYISLLSWTAYGEDNHQVTIKEFGFKDGIILTSTDNTKQLYWKLPYNLIEDAPKITLQLSYQTSLGGANILQIQINDAQHSVIPLQIQPSQIQQQKMKIEIMIPKSHFEDGGVNITFRFAGSSGNSVETNICSSGNYLKILPETVLSAKIDYNKITHFRDSLQLLDNQIIVYFPEQPTPESIRTLLQITGKLKNLGYEFQFSQLPSLQEEIILTPEELQLMKQLTPQWDTTSNTFITKSPQDILLWIKMKSRLTNTKSLIITPKDQQNLLTSSKKVLFFPSIISQSGSFVFDNDFIGINLPPLSFEDGEKYLAEWESYLSSSKKKVFKRHENSYQDPLEIVSFKDLNYLTSTIAFTLETNTNHLLRLLDLHKGKHIDQIHLHLSTSKGFSHEPPIFNIFFNRELIHSFKDISTEAIPQGIILNVPQTLLRTTNMLKIQAIQQPSEGLCRFSNVPLMLQINEESHIKTKPASSPPESFLDLPAYFFQGFTLFLPKDAAKRLNNYLPFLLNLSDFIPFEALKAVVLYQGISYPHDHRPFMAIGNLPLGAWEIPLPLPQDQFRLITPRSQQILEIKTTEVMGAMLQLISPSQSKTPYGLWIPQDTRHQFAKIKNLSLGFEDVIAFETNGDVRFTLWSHEPQKSVFRRLDSIKEDFTLYFRIATVIFWLVGIFFIIHLIRKNRNRPHNDE